MSSWHPRLSLAGACFFSSVLWAGAAPKSAEAQDQTAEAEPPEGEGEADSEPKPSTREDEPWLEWGTSKEDQRWEATVAEVLSRDPRNWMTYEVYHPGWIPVPGAAAEIRFGGFIQLNLIHDFQNAGVPTGSFVPSSIPVPTDQTSNTEFDIRSTRFIFETRAKTPNKVWLNAFISMDFDANADGTPAPRLRQAYFSSSHVRRRPQAILVGRANSTYFDLQTWPDVFDLEGPNGMTAKRTEMFRYSRALVHSSDATVADHVILTGAIENPETSVTNGEGLAGAPDIVVRLDLNYAWGHMAFAGLARHLVARSLLGGPRSSRYSGSGSASFNFPTPGSGARGKTAKADSVVGEVSYGTAGGTYILDLLSAGGQDGYYDDSSEGFLTRRQLALWAGYDHSWASKWRSAFVGGYVLINNRSVEPGNSFHSSIYVLGNVVYRPMPRFAIACEYYFGQRRDVDDQVGRVHRLMGVFKLAL